MKRKLNVVFLAVLTGILALVGGGAFILHRYQVQSHLNVFLDRARQAEANGDLDKTIFNLRRYLVDRPADHDVTAWLARTLERRFPDGPRRLQAYEACSQAITLNPEDLGVRRIALTLAMELRRYQDALNHLGCLYAAAGGEAAQGPDAAELEDLAGQCAEAQSQIVKAERWYRRAIEHDPTRITAHERLARMLRDGVKDQPAADKAIADMVARNLGSGRAYLTRWKYFRESGRPADDGDLGRALELAPDEADVLIAAAGPASRPEKRAEARRQIERGLKLYPQNVTFPILASSLEMQEGHPDQAEALLLQGMKAVPEDAKLPFLLADLLISRNKLDGKDGAAELIERLRGRHLTDGLIKYLEARTLVARRRWKEAVSALKRARSLLADDPASVGRLSLMLAECLGHIADEESRLAMLRQAVNAPEEATADTARIMLATSLENAGILEEALSQYEMLSRVRPEALMDVARVSIARTRRLPRVRQEWRRAEARVGEAEKAAPKASVDLALLRADLLTGQGRPREAIPLLETARKASPQDVRPWLSLAGIHQAEGEWAETLRTLDQAEKTLGPHAELWLARVKAWSRRGGDEAKQALTSLAGRIGKSSLDEQARLLDAMASAWLRLGEHDLARQSWRDVLEMQPENRRVLATLCDTDIEAGNHAEARMDATRLRSVEGEEGTLWRYAEVQILVDLARRGDLKALEAAPPLIGEITTRRGDWWGVSVLKGQVAEAQDRLDDAARHYQDAIKQGNTQPGLARRAVGLLSRMQKFDRIDALVQTLASHGMELEDLKLATALGALRRGELDRAVAIARQSLPQNSADPFDHVTLGQILQDARRIEEAGAEFQRAVDLGPKLPGTWLAQVQYLVQIKQTVQARAAVESARKTLPKELAASALARCYALIGDDKQAETYLQAALSARPDEPSLLRWGAQFYMDQKQGASAEPLLAKLADPATAASEEDQLWARRSRGLLSLQPGSTVGLDAAIKSIEENLKTNPQSFDDQRAHALLLATQPSRRSEAIADLEKRDASGSLDPERRLLLALIHLADNDRKKCEEQLQKLLDAKDRPRDPNILMVLVRVQLDQGHLKNAETWLAELKRLEPASPRVLGLECNLLKGQKLDGELLAKLLDYARDHARETAIIATLFEEFGFPKEAEEAYRRVLAENPKEADRQVRLIGFLGRQNRPGEALDLWEHARAIMTPDRAAEIGVSVISGPSATEAQRARVETWLAEALDSHPDIAVLPLKLAYVRMTRGRNDEARALYRQVLSKSPDNVEALNNLASLLAFQEGTKDEALTLIDRAIALGGSEPALLDTRAVVSLQRGETGPAFTDLSRVRSLSPGFPILYFHLARAHDQAENPAEARESFELAQRLGLKPEDVDLVERDEYARLRRRLFND